MLFKYPLSAVRAGPICLATCLGTAVPLAPFMAVAAEEENPAEIVAAQIRSQGYKCDEAKTAQRDIEASKPDEAVWILDCGNASYRVRLIPDMAADVERMD
jgi:hypothetical protein